MKRKFYWRKYRMPEIPDRLYIDKKDRELYNKLDQEEMLRFKGGGRTRKEQFFFALAFGFKNKIKYPLESKEGWFNTRDLQPEDETLLNAVAIYEAKSVDILSNKAEVYRIAEEYAHAGIKFLCNKIESTPFGTFEKQFEKELHDIYKNFNIPK
jgi:hypothetical protein